jgi:hypothetical protein
MTKQLPCLIAQLTLTLLLAVDGSVALSSEAAEASPLYEGKKLIQEKPRLENAVRQIWTKAYLPALTPEEKRRLSGLQLAFPLIREKPSLIDFSANSENDTISLSIGSLLFFEELSIAYAWLWANGYNLSTIDEYVAMLKYRKPSSFAGNRYPLPLPALHIPTSALANSKVDDLSLRFRNTAFAFILGHELGHIYHHHPLPGKIPTQQQIRDNETAADYFALELLRRTSTIPMGATLFFQASAYWFRNRGDYPNEQEWQSYLKEDAEHPLTADRLRLLAERMEVTAGDFARNESNKRFGIESVQFIARGITQIARILEDTNLQILMAKKSKKLLLLLARTLKNSSTRFLKIFAT